jgi:hypothetical protein
VASVSLSHVAVEDLDLYVYDEQRDAVLIANVQDGRSSTAVTSG